MEQQKRNKEAEEQRKQEEARERRRELAEDVEGDDAVMRDENGAELGEDDLLDYDDSDEDGDEAMVDDTVSSQDKPIPNSTTNQTSRPPPQTPWPPS